MKSNFLTVLSKKVNVLLSISNDCYLILLEKEMET